MIKIKANVIGIKKPIEVKKTVDKEDKADEMVIRLAELEEKAAKAESDADNNKEATEEEQTREYLEAVKANRKQREEIFDWLKYMLGLTSKQIEKARQSVDMEELGAYIFYVASRFQGMSDEDLELEHKKQEAAGNVDPKKE
ncbi:MAG TPA: hypothetical protein DDW47_07125 [Lactobacillus acetotolerans]|mgnify:FL=1|jgi:hypothetical protein|nr:hypothetical protein [Lactobacillus acetotolerans]